MYVCANYHFPVSFVKEGGGGDGGVGIHPQTRVILHLLITFFSILFSVHFVDADKSFHLITEQKYEQFKWQQQVGAPLPEGSFHLFYFFFF